MTAPTKQAEQAQVLTDEELDALYVEWFALDDTKLQWDRYVEQAVLSKLRPVAMVVYAPDALPFRKVAWLGQDIPIGTELCVIPPPRHRSPDRDD